METTLAYTLVLVIVIEGVWLAGLTYMMWKRHLRESKAKKEEFQAKTD